VTLRSISDPPDADGQNTLPDYSALSRQQLDILVELRRRRREIAQAADADIARIAETSRSLLSRRAEQRHRHMLLAGGTVTFVAPWLLQTNRAVAVEPLLAGACFLVLHIAVGAAIDLSDPWLLRHLTAAIGKSATASRARAAAEDHRLVAAQAGVFHAQLLRTEEAMVRADDSASVDVTSARDRLDWWQTLLDAMLHALFIAGVLCVGWAVVTGMLAHSRIRFLPIPAPPGRCMGCFQG
jgi:hypothetical protein